MLVYWLCKWILKLNALFAAISSDKGRINVTAVDEFIYLDSFSYIEQ